MSIALALSLMVIAYNNTINHWKPFHRGAYVPANLAFTGAVLAVALLPLGLERTDVAPIGDAHTALAISLLVICFAVVALAVARSRHSHLIADRRVAGLRGVNLGYHVLVRIPLGTGVTEELLFRGILFALWRDVGASSVFAALGASTAFGLWHIAPTVVALRMNDPNATEGKVRMVVIGAVFLTTVAGLFLTWLRVASGGLLVPVLLHAGINSGGVLAAVFASRATSRRAALERPLT